MANQPKSEPIKLKIETCVEIDPVKLKLLKTAYENSGGQAKESAFAALNAYKKEIDARIDGELLAYGNIAKRQAKEYFGV